MILDRTYDTRRVLTKSSARDTNPSFSPDGRKILWDSTRTGSYDIWIMDTDGSNQSNLTNSDDHDVAPSYSPDGSQIAFLRASRERVDLWVMDASGNNQRNLTRSMTSTPSNSNADIMWKFNTSWSLDGQYIVFVGAVRERGKLNLDLYVTGVEGGLWRVTSLPGDDIQPIWVH